MIVAFEGIDRAGKSTLRKLFSTETDFKHVTLDRFSTTARVYDRIFDRKDWQEREVDLEALESLTVTVVFVDTFPLICYNRGAEYSIEELNYHRKLFIEELVKLLQRKNIRVLVVNGENVMTNCLKGWI